MAWPPIEALVPHRAPMLLIDRVASVEGATMTCELTVRAGAMFVDAGAVPAAVFVEYMAQTAAAHEGLSSMRGSPRAGRLLGVREAVFDVDRALVGEVLTVKATRDWDDGESALYLGEVRGADGRRYASARFHVHRADVKETER
ncbi:MAG: hypothetical protein U0326_26610 [Polyangiales bacterium]